MHSVLEATATAISDGNQRQVAATGGTVKAMPKPTLA